jgi:hypothetical protein
MGDKHKTPFSTAATIQDTGFDRELSDCKASAVRITLSLPLDAAFTEGEEGSVNLAQEMQDRLHI